MDAPRFVKRSVNDGEKVKLAAIDPLAEPGGYLLNGRSIIRLLQDVIEGHAF